MAKPKVSLGAGHGGSDVGAINSKVRESDINLKVVKYAKAWLEARGVEVVMPRSSNVFVGLSERCDFANKQNAKLMIEVHHNAGGGDGFEVYHSIYNGVGRELAIKVAEQFKNLGQNAHGVPVKTRKGSSGSDYYTVISKSKMPCIITEFGFMDTTDYLAFDTDAELLEEAVAIGTAICNQLGVSTALKVSLSTTKKTGIVTASALYVRDGRSTNSKIIGTLSKGTQVRIGSKMGDWYNIYFGDHGGFVYAQYIK